MLAREPFGASERGFKVDDRSSEATSLHVVIDVPQEPLELGLVDLSPSVQQAKGVSDFEIVKRRPRYGATLAQFSAGPFRLRFGHVDGDQRARVEVDRHRSPRSATSC